MTVRSLASVLVALLAVAAAATPARATPEEARTFIEEMIRGVGAERVPCPDYVLEGTRVRRMSAVCARYDGDFDSFHSRWKLHLRRDEVLEQLEGRRRVPRGQPQTGWESVRGSYERIYSIGDTALGIMFDSGEILMVYK